MDADPITSGLTGETFTTSGDPIVDAAPHYWSEGKAIHAQLTWPSSKNSIKQTKSALWHRIRPFGRTMASTWASPGHPWWK